jgi:hypothetical protein
VEIVQQSLGWEHLQLPIPQIRKLQYKLYYAKGHLNIPEESMHANVQDISNSLVGPTTC